MKMSRALAAVLLVTTVMGCAPNKESVQFQFDVRFDGFPIVCDAAPGEPRLTDLRFFVHDLALESAGERYTIELLDDSQWQDGDVALLDFEDASGGCANGTRELNKTLKGVVRGAGSPRRGRLTFSVGVPESMNHADPMVAPPPRNQTIMHWHWRSGYKFMRAGVEVEGARAWLHLGSARCVGTITDIEGCESPNRPVVALPDFDPALDRIVIDVARLFGPALDGTAWSCESGPNESHCRVVFAELGIEFGSGRTLGPAPIFYRAPRQ